MLMKKKITLIIILLSISIFTLSKGYGLLKHPNTKTPVACESFKNLGFHYLNGTCVNKNPDKAIYYLTQSAIDGDVQAQNAIGCAYVDKGDIDVALFWFMKAADNGNLDAADNIAILYHESNKLKVDANHLKKYLIMASSH